MARNTGKRPHELTLELFAKQATVTPSEIDAYVNVGAYSSKHIWFLRKQGYDISVTRNGRNVVSYTYNGQGTATPAEPKPAKAPKAAKTPKAPKAPKVVAPAAETPSASMLTSAEIAEIQEDRKNIMREVAARMAAKRKSDDALMDEMSTGNGEIAASYNVDRDFDSVEGMDLTKMINAD